MAGVEEELAEAADGADMSNSSDVVVLLVAGDVWLAMLSSR